MMLLNLTKKSNLVDWLFYDFFDNLVVAYFSGNPLCLMKLTSLIHHYTNIIMSVR